jgi:alkane 1-monooxygenase
MLTAQQVARLQNALAFWMSLLLVPAALISAGYGGWTVLLLPIVTWYFFSLLDAVLGLNLDNADLETGEENLSWYKAITLIWAPLQFCLLFGMIWYVTGPGDAHLNALETIVLFVGVGVITGTVGINYSHELMHQKDRGDGFWAMRFWPWCSTRISAPSTCWCITATWAPRAIP